MAEPPPGQGTEFADLVQIGRAIASEIWSIENIQKRAKSDENTATKGASIFWGIGLGLVATFAAEAAKIIVNSEEIADPAFRRLAAIALKDITGVDTADLGGIGDRGGREGVARNVGAALLKAMTGTASGAVGAGGQLQPSTRPAEDFLTFTTQMALEGWLTGLLGEICTVGQVESLGDLDDALVNNLGINQGARSATAPLLDTLVRLPAEWHVNKTYRPQLLTASQACHEYLRGVWSFEQLSEELARQGYSPDRIEALLNQARKHFTVAQLTRAVRFELMTRDAAIEHLRLQGWSALQADQLLRLDEAERIERFNDQLGDAAIAAYAARRIDSARFNELIGATFNNPAERARARELGELKRAVNVRGAATSDVENAVKRNIIGRLEYRAHLEDEGYTADAVALLELLLDNEIRTAEDAERRKQQLAEQRAEEKRVREEERRRRQAALEAERAVTEPSLGDVRQAVIRGLLSTADYQAFLASEKYDGAAIGFLTDMVLEQRAEYVALQERRRRLEEAAARKQLNVGQLEAAVLLGVLSPADYRGALTAAGFSAGDADVLVRTLEARIEERRLAEERRRQREEELAQRGISLSQAEQAVLRGIGTVAQFEAWLTSQGFQPFDVAVLSSLLQARAADQAAARAKREENEARARNRGLSLDQLEAAIIEGLRPFDAYETALLKAGFAASEVPVLVDLFQLDVERELQRRQKRAEAEEAARRRGASLADLERAVRLGILGMPVYRARLVELGFVAGDVDILVELLVTEIQRQRDREERAAAAAAAALERDVSLAQFERAVLAGVRTLDSYRAFLEAQAFDDAERELLLQLLQERVAEQARQRQVREAAAAAAAEKSIGLADLERAVKSGLASLPDYAAALERGGFDQVSRSTLIALLEREISDLAEARRRRDAIAAAGDVRELTLSTQERAVRAGLVSLPAYAAWLEGQGYEPGDVALLVDLVAVSMTGGSPNG